MRWKLLMLIIINADKFNASFLLREKIEKNRNKNNKIKKKSFKCEFSTNCDCFADWIEKNNIWKKKTKQNVKQNHPGIKRVMSLNNNTTSGDNSSDSASNKKNLSRSELELVEQKIKKCHNEIENLKKKVQSKNFSFNQLDWNAQ